jgi:type III pantothenate kinase
MQLVVDIGNTLTKAALFKDLELVQIFRTEKEPVYLIKEIYDANTEIGGLLISSVNKAIDADLIPIPETIHHVIFDHQTPVPLDNLYQSKETLGLDRMANAVAAKCGFPQKNVLVIDIGTCITYDLVTDKGTYPGGNISPGIRLRFEVLHSGTARLPLLTSYAEQLRPDRSCRSWRRLF